MSNITKVFEYNGTQVTFESGDSTMVNATEMARCFGKRPVIWLQSQQANEFLEELAKVKNLTLADLVVVTRGGDNPGTWMHEDVAIEFAHWLSPAFAIWCNERIKELMKFGITAAPSTIEAIISDPQNAVKLLTSLIEERQRNAKLAAENATHKALIAEKDAIIEENKPKVVLAKSIEDSETLILIRDMAKQLKQGGYDTGGDRFREQLIKDGYLTKDGEPSQRSMELKIMRVVETVVTTPRRSFIRRTPKITGKGQTYFCNKYLGYVPQGTVKFPNN